ncbi:hypothetical protein F8M41_020243 [Gigaspora margarita]|uniref:Uncharacterized protein n=1 Tax=Gigaspora margarita TaxID=4874 RepID=A0A8H4B1U4_GIGMA|nr:hypothetical protein F8M41_020243 [Gigaspora margarita]
MAIQNRSLIIAKKNGIDVKIQNIKNIVDMIIKYVKKFVMFAMNLVLKKEHWLVGQIKRVINYLKKWLVCGNLRSKKPITVVLKFNIFNSQDLFDNIFTSNKTYNGEKRIGLHQRFSKSLAYTHGYMIRFTGQYLNRRVFFSIVTLENQKNHQPRDLTDFINGRFDIKFNEECEVDINYVLGGIICDINYEDNSFWVYNSYWNKDLPDNILLPKNLKTIDQKLQEKILQKYQIEYTTSKRNKEENLQIERSKRRCIDN